MELENKFYKLKSEYNNLKKENNELDIVLDTGLAYLEGFQFISVNDKINEEHKKLMNIINEFYKSLVNYVCIEQMLTDLSKQELIILHELFIKNDVSILDDLDMWNSKFLILVGFYFFLKKNIIKAEHYIRLAINININENLYLAILFLFVQDYINVLKYLKLAKPHCRRNLLTSPRVEYNHIITVYQLIQFCYLLLGDHTK